MSRIEEALEKALKMRKPAREDVQPEKHPEDYTNLLKIFEVKEKVIDAGKVDRHIVCITDPGSLIPEQYRKLRANLIKRTKEDFRNTIMVTSPEIGEGKSITSINLAVSLSMEYDYTVLLVDADLKNPSIHRYLGIDPQYGLSDYLLGEVSIPDILIKTGLGKLVLLPAGNASSSADTAELLSSSRMLNLVSELKHRYKDRYVIFDSPPILAVSDTISLSGYMDGILLVLQAARSTPKAALQALSHIKGSNMLGVVFNGVPDYLAKNLYPYYYRYGKDAYHSNLAEATPDPKDSK
jgi:exopolysaccharide/PEP-CTERM locus tyrosine autokinase